MRPCALAHEQNIARGEIEHGREVWEIAGPVGPGGHEAGEVSEGALAPDIEAAFVGIAGRKLEHGKCERSVEAKPCADPDDDGTGPSGGGGGDPAKADAGYYVEQNQVTKAEDAFRAVRIFAARFGDGGKSQVAERWGQSGITSGGDSGQGESSWELGKDSRMRNQGSSLRSG